MVYTQGVTALDAQKGLKFIWEEDNCKVTVLIMLILKQLVLRFFMKIGFQHYLRKKISVKYDAFNSQMITSSGQMLIPFDGISLKLENGETWLTFNKKWYKLINQKNDFTFLINLMQNTNQG